MKHTFHTYEYSMRKLWDELLVFLVFAMIGIFLLLNQRQQTELIRSTAQTQFDSLSKFSTQLNNGLTQAEDYLYSSFCNNENVFAMTNSQSTLTQYKAKQELADLLSRVVQLNEFVEAAWFYQSAENSGTSEEVFLSRNNYTGISIREIMAMKSLLSDSLFNPTESKLLSNTRWSLVRLEDTCYLLWVTPVDNAFCGAWVSMPYLYTLMQDRTPVSSAETDHICDLQGNSLLHPSSSEAVFDLPDDTSSWILSDRTSINIGIQSEKSDFVFQKIFPYREVLHSTKNPSHYTYTAVVLLFFCVITITVILYQALIYRPFQQLLTNMGKIHFQQQDDAGNRLPVKGHFSDIKVLSTSINQLLDKNQELNQKIFESQIRERDVQVQYLQIRLKAHFYMNGLSLIHAMSRMGQNDLIQELSQCLIEYLRFIDVDTQRFVRIREELDHVRSYARIQELRFPGLFQYTEDVSAELYDASIPPLVLQTFVENSIEHGMRQGENYEILIQAFYEEKEENPGMRFRIQDNGTGFSEDQLREFSQEHYAIILNQNHGIGIKNVINRLRLLYDGRAEIHFDNMPEGGAAISLWLPLLDLEEDETDEI